jgi:hypothetical protein
MLRWILILGGLLIMMGHHARSEALFYPFRPEDRVPENHLLRLIDKHRRLHLSTLPAPATRPKRAAPRYAPLGF